MEGGGLGGHGESNRGKMGTSVIEQQYIFKNTIKF